MKQYAQELPVSVIAGCVNAAFGKKLQQCRLSKGMTQGVVADRAGLSRVSVANIENGRQNVTLQQLFLFAMSLDMPTGELMPTSVDLERCSLRELGPLPATKLSHADSRFLEDTRSMLVAILRSASANSFAESRD